MVKINTDVELKPLSKAKYQDGIWIRYGGSMKRKDLEKLYYVKEQDGKLYIKKK